MVNEANTYAQTTKQNADSYYAELRAKAEEESNAVVADAQARAQNMIEDAKAQAEELVSKTTVLARAEATAPEPFLAVRAIGIFFARKGMKDRARHYLGKAHRIDPDEETVRNLLAGLGDPDRAARDKEPKISACMIVKDEEQCLKRCLDSVVDLVD